MAETKEHVDWTAGDLASHCDWLIERGYAKDATAKAQKTAVVKVFEYTEGDGWETTSIKELGADAEDLLNRFAMLARRDFKGQSLATYQGRFRKALESYRTYMEDPANFRGIIRPRTTAEPNKSPQPQGSGHGVSRRPNAAEAKPAAHDPAQLITYPFPVRQGVLAELKLPADLQEDEAKRLGGFLQSLAVKEVRALPAGHDD